MCAELRRTERDPANELYDCACNLLADAGDLRRAAARHGNDAALAATLGCLQSVLGELAATYRLLRQTSSSRLVHEPHGFARRFDEAAACLEQARAASDDARAFVGPLLADLPRIGSRPHRGGASGARPSEHAND